MEAIIEASGLNAQDSALNQSATRRADGLHGPIPNVEKATLLATDSSEDKAAPLTYHLLIIRALSR